MTRVVLDTNILVSALWSADGKPAGIVREVLTGRLAVCYDHRMMEEYTAVLSRPKFRFAPSDIRDLLSGIKTGGLSVVAPKTEVAFTDETDRKFYEVAKFCGAVLVTGNRRHYPDEPSVMTAAAFLEEHAK
ncbi:MAG: putative toxin-antitoxin system toxin component, PIN family [Oscillospiraceae bacterium]|jgi:putative PIN family toxin of toxin-antitoxin system|nr:putative toxin-antitoxin system toxin component, PIN family [Oscillospiraceae bacterium]